MTVNQTTSPAPEDMPFRVMVVDDSAVIRSFLKRFIEEDDSLKVTNMAVNGQKALEALAHNEVDVIVLDIEMPVMDGLTALPLIRKTDPHVQVVIASTLTKENAMITMKCFQAGAADCLAKPQAQEMTKSADNFKNALVLKLKELSRLTRRKRARGGVSGQPVPVPGVVQTAEKKFDLLPAPAMPLKPQAIIVGSSTGGPQALLDLFKDLATPLKQPVFVTQHMPPTFTAILADNIAKQSGLPCHEGVDGEVVKGGEIYLAPGDYHMTVVEDGYQKKIRLNQEPPESFCRPAVDPMVRSIVEVYGKNVLAVILTGMGADGLKSCKSLVEKGGIVLSQDEATSVVWGMPGAVAKAGICTNVLPLGLMAKEMRRYAEGSA